MGGIVSGHYISGLHFKFPILIQVFLGDLNGQILHSGLLKTVRSGSRISNVNYNICIEILGNFHS